MIFNKIIIKISQYIIFQFLKIFQSIYRKNKILILVLVLVLVLIQAKIQNLMKNLNKYKIKI
jgi:hypothetical protein